MIGQSVGEKQTIWDWRIAAYLALAGLGGGAYIMGVAIDLADFAPSHSAKAGVMLGPILVALSTLFLIWDLGKPTRFMFAGFRPNSSWISRGVFILSTFIAIGVLHFGLWVFPFDVLDDAEGLRTVIGVAGGLFAVGTVTYTGLLLGAVRGIPFWSTPALPLLFLASGLSTGLMGVELITALRDAIEGETPIGASTPLKMDSALIAVEATVLLMYLYMGYVSHIASRASVLEVVRGELGPVFWGGVVLLGLALPLAVQILYLTSYTDAGQGTQIALTLIATIPGLIGGFILRYIVVSAAIKVPLMVQGRPAPVRGGVRFRVEI